jgi:hypothetical protein
VTKQTKKQDQADPMEQAKEVMRRLAETPHKPHVLREKGKTKKLVKGKKR